MSEEELKKLKQEIKREILNEMTRKELVKDNSLKYFMKLLLLVFIVILFSLGIVSFVIYLISWLWNFFSDKIY